MDTETKTIFDMAAKKRSSTEVFAKPPSDDITLRDLFAGDEEFYQSIENDGKPPVTERLAKAPDAIASGISRFFSHTMVILVINLLAISVFFGYLLLKPGNVQFVTPPAKELEQNE